MRLALPMLLVACTQASGDDPALRPAIAPPPDAMPAPPDAPPPPPLVVDPRSGSVRIYAWDGKRLRSLYCSPLPAAGAKRTLAKTCAWPTELTLTLAGAAIIARGRTVTLDQMAGEWRGSVYTLPPATPRTTVIVESARGLSVWSAAETRVSRAFVPIPAGPPALLADHSGIAATTAATLTVGETREPATYRIAIRGGAFDLSSWTAPVPLLSLDADADGHPELITAATDDAGLYISVNELGASFHASIAEQ
jgi:hypothetical protein